MKNNNSNRKQKSDENDEVEQLLRAAQDDVLLKLSIDSHIAHVSSNYLETHLDRRFQALKSRPSFPKSTPSSQSQSQSQSPSPSPSQSTRQSVDVDDELKSVIGDDLSARFAALKASSSSANNYIDNTGVVVGPKISVDGDDEDDEDEVEKIIRWAKDAARLDPSPPSDDDKDSDSDSDDDDDGDDDGDHNRKKGHCK